MINPVEELQMDKTMTKINSIKTRMAALFSSLVAMVGACGSICASACLTGACCGTLTLPLLGFLGLSSSALQFLEKLKPVFLLITILSLAYAFYTAYKPKQTASIDATCGTSSSCCVTEKQTFIQSKAFLWAVTILCAIMWLYPLIDRPYRGSQINCDNPCETQVNAISDGCRRGSDGQK